MIEYPGAVYHITGRGNERQEDLLDEAAIVDSLAISFKGILFGSSLF